MRDPLHPVANPEHRYSQRKHLRIALGRVGVINRARPARQHDSRGLQLADFFDRRGAWQDGGEHLLFADAARNQLRILPAEIENHHAAEFRPHSASLLLSSLRRLFCRALHHAIPPKPRRDSIICPARKCASRCVCRRDEAQLPDRLAPALRLLLPQSPRRLSPCPAGDHLPARGFRLRPRASRPHQTPASPLSTIRLNVRAFPIVLPQGVASWAPASASAVPAVACELPAVRFFPAAPASKSRWS